MAVADFLYDSVITGLLSHYSPLNLPASQLYKPSPGTSGSSHGYAALAYRGHGRCIRRMKWKEHRCVSYALIDRKLYLPCEWADQTWGQRSRFRSCTARHRGALLTLFSSCLKTQIVSMIARCDEHLAAHPLGESQAKKLQGKKIESPELRATWVLTCRAGAKDLPTN